MGGCDDFGIFDDINDLVNNVINVIKVNDGVV